VEAEGEWCFCNAFISPVTSGVYTERSLPYQKLHSSHTCPAASSDSQPALWRLSPELAKKINKGEDS